MLEETTGKALAKSKNPAFRVYVRTEYDPDHDSLEFPLSALPGLAGVLPALEAAVYFHVAEQREGGNALSEVRCSRPRRSPSVRRRISRFTWSYFHSNKALVYGRFILRYDESPILTRLYIICYRMRTV